MHACLIILTMRAQRPCVVLGGRQVACAMSSRTPDRSGLFAAMKSDEFIAKLHVARSSYPYARPPTLPASSFFCVNLYSPRFREYNNFVHHIVPPIHTDMDPSHQSKATKFFFRRTQLRCRDLKLFLISFQFI
jgi:hypothetical protein